MTGNFSESYVEETALSWLEDLGYAVLHGPDSSAGETASEGSDPNYRAGLLPGRLLIFQLADLKPFN